MFKCDNCGDQVAVNQPMNKVVVKQRDRNYENYPRRKVFNPRTGKREYEENPRRRPQPIYSSGWEIVKEIAACPKCFVSFTGMQPKTKEPTPPRRFYPRFTDEASNRKWGDRAKTQQVPREQKERKQPVVEVVNQVKLERS